MVETLLSAQFCYERETALKDSLAKKKILEGVTPFQCNRSLYIVKDVSQSVLR